MKTAVVPPRNVKKKMIYNFIIALVLRIVFFYDVAKR